MQIQSILTESMLFTPLFFYRSYNLYQTHFTMKNRTIPLSSKEEIEVQTDVKYPLP
jgi:hypothetical protein